MVAKRQTVGAHYGLTDWLIQRLSAIVMVVFTALVLGIALWNGGIDYALWEQLVARYARLSGYSGRLLYAVNQEFSTLETQLHEGDEVAFIPPVSGGVIEH